MLGLSRVVLRAPAARIGRGRVGAEVLAGEEQQPELADLDLVPSGQLGLLDALPVDVGAVEAAYVADVEESALALEFRVPPGDRHVVEEDVTFGVPAGCGQPAIQPEPAARVRAAHDQQQRAPLRQRAQGGGVREEIVTEIGILRPAQRQRRRGLARAGAEARNSRHRPGLGQLGPAIRAEPGAVGIRPAAPGAVDRWHASGRPPLGELIRRSSPRYLDGGLAVHAPREQPALAAFYLVLATLPPHRRLTSAVYHTCICRFRRATTAGRKV